MIMSDLSASVLKRNKKTLSLPANAHQRRVTIVYKDEVRFLRQQNSEQQHVFV
jgi:spermidine synthase